MNVQRDFTPIIALSESPFSGLEELEPRLALNAAEMAWVIAYLGIALIIQQLDEDLAEVQAPAGAELDLSLKPTDVDALQTGGSIDRYFLRFNAPPEGVRLFDWEPNPAYTPVDATLDSAIDDRLVAGDGPVRNKAPIGSLKVTVPTEPGEYEISLSLGTSFVNTSLGNSAALLVPRLRLVVEEPTAVLTGSVDLENATPLVPGAPASFTTTLTNPAAGPVNLKGSFNAFLSRDDVFDPADDVPIVEGAKLNMKLDAGESCDFTTSFTLPAAVLPGDHKVFLQFGFDDVTIVVDGGEDGFVNSDESFEVRHAFGTVVGRPGVVDEAAVR
jgi:hypothetical protein